MTMQGHAKSKAWLAFAVASALSVASVNAIAADRADLKAMETRANFSTLQANDTYLSLIHI